MPPEIKADYFELGEHLGKLRAIAELRARTVLPLGDLIGAGEVAPCVVEVRMAPPGYGWLCRSQESGGQWISVPDSTWCSFEDVKLRLSASWPMHLCVWFESDEAFSWFDA